MLVTRKYTYLVENVGFTPRFDSKSSPLLPKYDKTPVADVSPFALPPLPHSPWPRLTPDSGYPACPPCMRARPASPAPTLR